MASQQEVGFYPGGDVLAELLKHASPIYAIEGIIKVNKESPAPVTGA